MKPDSIRTGRSTQRKGENERLEQLFDEKQIARNFGLAVGTLQQWRHRGDGPPYIKLGRSVRYKESEVVSWLEANTVTSTSAVVGG